MVRQDEGVSLCVHRARQRRGALERASTQPKHQKPRRPPKKATAASSTVSPSVVTKNHDQGSNSGKRGSWRSPASSRAAPRPRRR